MMAKDIDKPNVPIDDRGHQQEDRETDVTDAEVERPGNPGK
jgi:hypothetical protein